VTFGRKWRKVLEPPPASGSGRTIFAMDARLAGLEIFRDRES